VESLGPGNTIFDSIIGLDADGARSAFDQLSGEIHASAMSAFIEDSWFVRDAMNDRLRAAPTGSGDQVTSFVGSLKDAAAIAPATPGRFAAWARGFGSWGSFDSDGNAAALDTTTGGVLTGMDGLLTDPIRVGLLAGYSHLSFDADQRASSGAADNYHFGFYAGTQWGDLGLRSGLAYTWSDIETNRAVIIPALTNRLNADYDAGLFQAFGELGYRLNTPVATFEPFINLAYVSLDTNDFTEEGGAAALRGRGMRTEATFTTVGFHAAVNFSLGPTNITFDGTLGWRHAFGDIIPTAALSFAGSDIFTIAGVPIAEDAAVIEAGLGLELAPNATLGVAYQGQIADDSAQHGVKGDLRIRF
jgi:outer membrane autotransporter protein